MIISVASGKGGTGKTTVAVNLALSLNNVQFLDCDVEEPNAHIFLKPEINIEKLAYTLVPEINKDKCNFCGRCSEACEFNAIAILKSKVLVFPELCHGCGACKLVCPADAIEEKNKNIGVIRIGKTGNIDYVEGVLNVGEPMSTPLIRKVKKEINKNKTVIIDASPGVACPVIETVYGSDYCVLVTEPTPFGLYDLKLAVGVLRKMNIPFGVVINRDGIGDKKVEKYCEKEKIRIMMKIPISRDIASLYSKGIPFVNEMPGWKEKFIDLLEEIKNEIDR
ncbi:MAG: ATP-binding protein [Candidatus Thermoplasmatota archaeon]|nr:ATP-binding protein [Candidatus Thermoplasmatota archaeon]